MKTLQSLCPITILLFAAFAPQSARSQGPKVLVVATDGSAPYRTVLDAIDAAPDGHVRIDIKPGEYRQVLSIKANGVELRGLGKRPEDVVLVYDNSAASAVGTGKSGTLSVSGNDFHAGNLTIANDFEKRHPRTNEGSQAVALLLTGDRAILRHVRLLGYQDTLYASSGVCHSPGETGVCHASRQYFADCYIEGHVDFIFGDAKAVFDRCEIHAMPHPVVTITAQSRVRPEEDSGYVFRDCTVTAEPGTTDILLGRPWRDYSTVLFIDTDFKAPLDPRGWLEWGGRLKTSTYAEFNSHGLSSDLALRVPPSRQLTPAEVAPYTSKSFLAGSDSWNPDSWNPDFRDPEHTP
jgi:pectin methylesterase-like acyl-CoA thioesterase